MRESFVDAMFAKRLPKLSEEEKEPALIDRLLVGGYPEVQKRRSSARRREWFTSYINTILQRDVRDLANIEGLTLMPRLLALLATRAGALLNFADVARSIQIPQTTLKRYLALLETTFLVQLLLPWYSNLGLRIVKSPKLYISDCGLLVHLLTTDRERLGSDPSQLGHVLENFVVTELRKQISWSKVFAKMYHYRTTTGSEVDIVLEGAGARIVGIEVKASATISAGDFKGLKTLAEAVGDRFHRGVLLYSGKEALPFGKQMHALPVSALWRIGQ